MDVLWTADGQTLLLSGDSMLGMIQRPSNSSAEWKLTFSNDIFHSKPDPIFAMTWVNDSVLATATKSKTIRLWNFPEKKLLHTAVSAVEVLQMGYCRLNKTLSYIDYECNLGILHKQFPEFSFQHLSASDREMEMIHQEVMMNDVDIDVNDI